MYSGWMYSIPVITFAIISGSLSDRLGFLIELNVDIEFQIAPLENLLDLAENL